MKRAELHVRNARNITVIRINIRVRGLNRVNCKRVQNEMDVRWRVAGTAYVKPACRKSSETFLLSDKEGKKKGWLHVDKGGSVTRTSARNVNFTFLSSWSGSYPFMSTAIIFICFSRKMIS